MSRGRKVAGLGPQLFPDLEDSAGHPKVFLLSHRQPLEVSGQMLPCQPARATHGYSEYQTAICFSPFHDEGNGNRPLGRLQWGRGITTRRPRRGKDIRWKTTSTFARLRC